MTLRREMRRVIGFFSLGLLCVCLAAPGSVRAAETAVRRFGLIVGANNGGQDRPRLRYAGSDARAVASVLEELGGVSPEDRLLLIEPSRASLNSAVSELSRRIVAHKGNAQRVEVLLYYSGHSDEEGLLFGGERLSYPDLRKLLYQLPADVRIAILDSCASGALIRTKGGKRRPPFLTDASTRVEGHAFLTSSAEDEAAQESDRIKGSYFTRSLVTGLRGAADVTRDGQVTLNEAYQFAFHETLAHTERTASGPQHPTYDIRLVGTGDLVLTDLRATTAGIVLEDMLAGTFYIRDGEGRLIASMRKTAGQPIELGFAPGTYRITLIDGEKRLEAPVILSPGKRLSLRIDQFQPVEVERTARRGGSSGGTDGGNAASAGDASVSGPHAAARPGGGGAPGKSGEVPGVDRLENDDLPGAADRPEDGDASGTDDRPEDGDAPDNVDRPEDGNAPGTDDRPDDGDAPDNVDRPEDGDAPGNVDRPENGDAPGDGIALAPEPGFEPRSDSRAPGRTYRFVPFVLSVFPPLSTHPREDPDEVVGISLGILASRHNAVDGATGAAVGSWVDGDVFGLQASGFGNLAGGHLRGLQASGAFNYTGVLDHGVQGAGGINVAIGPGRGAQLSGGLNVASSGLLGGQVTGGGNFAGGAVNGVQLSGGINAVTGGMWGLQGTGGANLAFGGFSGLQGAGGLNLATGVVSGLQISGGLNVATSGILGGQVGPVNLAGGPVSTQLGVLNVATGPVGWVQIGVVNIADDVVAPIGVLSIVRKGYHTVGVWGDELRAGHVGVKTGGRVLYNHWSIGVRDADGERQLVPGLALGAHLGQKRVFADLELNGSTVIPTGTWQHDNTLASLKLSIGIKLLPYLTVIGGPSINVLTTWEGSSFDPGFQTWDLYSSSDVNVQAWPGLHLGLQL